MKLFTSAELDLLATPLSIRLERAALARHGAAVPAIVRQMHIECARLYDAYQRWLSVLQAFISEHMGEGGNERALSWVAEFAARPFVDAYAPLDVRGRVERLAQRLRASGSTFWVVEDAERVRFRLDSWGPLRTALEPEGWEGQRLWRRTATRVRYPRGAEPRSSAARILAVERQFLETVPTELFGAPLAVISPGRLDVAKEGGPARLFSAPELERLGTPLALQVEQAAAAGDWGRLLDISAGMDRELVCAKDPLGVMIAGLLTWIARQLGEPALDLVLARTAGAVMPGFLRSVARLDTAASVRAWASAWRAHGSTFWIEEDDDTLVFRGSPLGACHRMWARAGPGDVERISDSRVRYPTFGCYDPPASFHRVRGPSAITVGQTDYPVYSCHCHVLHEIYPIDHIGRPLWVEDHPLDDPNGETIHVHYKDQAAWPEHYYARVGRERPRHR
jgi:hypothetical protein